MPVDANLQPLLEMLNRGDGPQVQDLPPAEARALYKGMAQVDGDPVAVRSVGDRTVPGPGGPVPVRIVVPETGDDAPHGVLVWFHGGGFVIGDLDTSEGSARRLAALAGCVVVSVDYRLAPEAPAPAALEDCWAATAWVADHRAELGLPADAPIAVGGDSAGGNLAALVALRAGRAGTPTLAFQLLVYPVTDHTASSASIRENGEGYLLTARAMDWFTEQYLGGSDLEPDDPTVSPQFAADDALRATPPALVLVAGYDPLRDEGRAYGTRLASLGVSAEVVEYPTMIHGFFSLGGVTPVAVEAAECAAEALRRAFAD